MKAAASHATAGETYHSDSLASEAVVGLRWGPPSGLGAYLAGGWRRMASMRVLRKASGSRLRT